MKLIVLTGAQGAIGRAVTKILKKDGFDVFAIDNLPNNEIDYLCDNFHASLIDWKEKFQDLVLTEETLEIQGLILVHGAHEIGANMAASDLRNDAVIESNFFSTVDYVSFFSKFLKPGSTILYLGSIVSLLPLPYSAIYSATKTAIQGFLLSHRISLLRAGIMLKILLVGNVNTGFNEKGQNISFGEIAEHDLRIISSFINSDKGMQVHKVARKIVWMLHQRSFTYEVYGRNAKLLYLALRVLGFNFTLYLVELLLFGKKAFVRRKS